MRGAAMISARDLHLIARHLRWLERIRFLLAYVVFVLSTRASMRSSVRLIAWADEAQRRRAAERINAGPLPVKQPNKRVRVLHSRAVVEVGAVAELLVGFLVIAVAGLVVWYGVVADYV